MFLFDLGLDGLKIFSSSSSSVSDLVLSGASFLFLNPIVMAACCNFISIPPFLLLLIVRGIVSLIPPINSTCLNSSPIVWGYLKEKVFKISQASSEARYCN